MPRKTLNIHISELDDLKAGGSKEEISIHLNQSGFYGKYTGKECILRAKNFTIYMRGIVIPTDLTLIYLKTDLLLEGAKPYVAFVNVPFRDGGTNEGLQNQNIFQNSGGLEFIINSSNFLNSRVDFQLVDASGTLLGLAIAKWSVIFELEFLD